MGFILTYSILTEKKKIFEKQLGFTANNSTDHALLELLDELCDALMKKSCCFF